ncbi:hypothetical protein [Serratia fonticola]|uniref:hypothetical protein n=1 Tax=Serratia fonticola TaxID=47917 RepID=UPI00217BEB84|nr:hypothetical protein [Serratia fonticola]CAI1545122.1 Uncharacterised protein [Serratia fonticola]
MRYAFIKNATFKKLEKGSIWLKQINDDNIIDISLNVGQLGIPFYKDADKEFFDFINSIDDYCHALAALFPFISIEPQERLHSTLLTIFNDTRPIFDSKKSELVLFCRKIVNIYNKIGALKIKFKDVLLTSNGTLILIGESSTLMNFRKEVYDTIAIPQELHKNIIHITLGRLLVDTTNDNMLDLYDYLLMNGQLDLPELLVSKPKFVVCNDSLATKHETPLTTHFNKLW